jgi:TIR domain
VAQARNCDFAAVVPYGISGAGLPADLKSTQRQVLVLNYSTLDQEFAERLYADLQARGVRCWFAPHDMKGGEIVLEQIDAAI